MEGLRQRDAGPYWLGRDISLVDLTFFPHLDRFCAVEHYRGISIPDDYTQLKAWLALMKALPSAQATGHPEQAYIRNWGKYAFNTSTGTTARDMRES
jgi:glutathione S-transferase